MNIRSLLPWLLIPGLSLLLFACRADGRYAVASKPATEERIVEAGCGECIFEIPGATGCPLAVRIDGRAYLVRGSGIDDHGDAHAPDGLCNSARRARVRGRIEGDEFVAEAFELLPVDADGR